MSSAAASDQLDLIFHALADSTRRSILQRITSDAMSVSDIASLFTISLAAVSKHLKVLERAGLISRHKKGRTHYLILKSEGLVSASEWLDYYEQFWTERLQSLQTFLESTDIKGIDENDIGTGGSKSANRKGDE